MFSQIDVVPCITFEGRMRSESLEVHNLVKTEVTEDAVPVDTFKGERVLVYNFPSASMQARGQDFVAASMMRKLTEVLNGCESIAKARLKLSIDKS